MNKFYEALIRMEYQQPEIGDYCFAHAWKDADPHDPWSVGFLKAIRMDVRGTLYLLEGKGVLDRWFRYCRPVSSEQGADIIEQYQIAIEDDPVGLSVKETL